MCQDQLQKLREVNSLLQRTNSPVEKEKIIRLEQECRKSAQNLQEVTNDFNELKALSESLQRQLERTEQQRTAALSEAEDNHKKLQSTAAELSKLKVEKISSASNHIPCDHPLQLESMSLSLEQKEKELSEAQTALQKLSSKADSLQQDKNSLQQNAIQRLLISTKQGKW